MKSPKGRDVKKFFRTLSLAAVGIGSTLTGFAFYEGWQRGFSLDLELGNWDPFIKGATGAAIAALGAVAYLYFAHAAEGGRRRHALARALRGFAALMLSGLEMLGLLAAVSAFIIFLTLERAGGGGIWALGVCACGIVTNVAARPLLTWAKGDTPPPKETSVASFDDRD
ncbi:MAG TPA: hypothetical protein VL426_00295 [Candidatus Binatia bacterium]|nr:hypothetical protein [Candidatus Binatia bacterium]